MDLKWLTVDRYGVFVVKMVGGIGPHAEAPAKSGGGGQQKRWTSLIARIAGATKVTESEAWVGSGDAELMPK
jgi:hypothetical protein